MPLLKLPGPSHPSPLFLPSFNASTNSHDPSPSSPLKRPASPSFDTSLSEGSSLDDYFAPLSRKRSKSDDPLLQIVPKEHAWILPEEMLVTQLPCARCYSRAPRSEEIVESQWGAVRGQGKGAEQGESRPITVLAILGMQMVQYELLSTALPTLLSLSPDIRIAAISHSLDPSLLAPSSPFDTPPIPIIAPPPPSLLVRLGLVHPLGGGHMGLDSIVVLDSSSRRRVVIPVGWGAGAGLTDSGWGPGAVRRGDNEGLIRGRVVDALLEAVRVLEEERGMGC